MTITASPLPETPSGKNREGENFPVGSFLIRPGLRVHIHALYDFARAADDISDHPLLEAAEKIRRLDRFAEIIVSKEGGDVAPAVAMRQSLLDTKITPQHCLDLLTAFKRDATKLRYNDWPDLLDYCRYSASPVGRHVLALHGIGETAWASSDACCSALQIINHIQDCADDYRQLDRVYIPNDILTRNGATTADLAKKTSSHALRQALDEMLAKTSLLMPLAKTVPHFVPDVRLKLETAVIASLASKLITLLYQRDPLCDHVKLSKGSVAMAALGGILRAWF